MVSMSGFSIIERNWRAWSTRTHITPLAFGVDGVEASEDLPEPKRPVNTIS